MTNDRDRVESARENAEAETAGAVDRAQDRQDVERALERDVRHDVERTVNRPVQTAADTGDRAALFESSVLSEFNTRWTDIQAGFVDEPRRAVQQADALVSDVINRITDSFTNERTRLEQQWDRGDDVSTEELRQALQRYRTFFSRLLTL